MSQTILDAKAELETAGLQVKPSGEGSLWIAATTKDAGDGIRLSNDATALLRRKDGWVALFPADGMLSYEVPGDLDYLLPLIQGVYAQYRLVGGTLKDAFRRAVPNPDSYLVGRFPLTDSPVSSPIPRREEVAHSRSESGTAGLTAPNVTEAGRGGS